MSVELSNEMLGRFLTTRPVCQAGTGGVVSKPCGVPVPSLLHQKVKDS